MSQIKTIILYMKSRETVLKQTNTETYPSNHLHEADFRLGFIFICYFLKTVFTIFHADCLHIKNYALDFYDEYKSMCVKLNEKLLHLPLASWEYSMPETVHLRKTILFSVRVPVLSENIY